MGNPRHQLLQEQGNARAECFNMLQILVTICYSKLVNHNLTSNLANSASIQQNLKLMTYILNVVFTDQNQKPLKDCMEVVIYFTQSALREIIAKFEKVKPNL